MPTRGSLRAAQGPVARCQALVVVAAIVVAYTLVVVVAQTLVGVVTLAADLAAAALGAALRHVGAR